MALHFSIRGHRVQVYRQTYDPVAWRDYKKRNVISEYLGSFPVCEHLESFPIDEPGSLEVLMQLNDQEEASLYAWLAERPAVIAAKTVDYALASLDAVDAWSPLLPDDERLAAVTRLREIAMSLSSAKAKA